MRSSTRLAADLAHLLATLRDIQSGRIKLPPYELRRLAENVNQRVSEIRSKLDNGVIPSEPRR